MIKFMMKSFMLTTILLFGVLLGMQLANNGMIKMKGYEDPEFLSAFTVSQTKEGEIKASVLGSKVRTLDLQQKQEQLEERKAFNFFSSFGKKFADAVHSAINKVVGQ
ncbi:YqxA family protein [Bacillus songklensis]|uniref:YqxA family protein n=1 Tax=Bacillus songklensis TaxID=1069116 RepID=A0ABV8B098_9BACI